MDPATILTVLGALYSVARTALDKFKKLEELTREQKRVSAQYQDAVESLTTEASEVQVLFKSIVDVGDSGALNALLTNSDGQMAAQRLLRALKGAEELFKAQDHAADKLIRKCESGGAASGQGLLSKIFYDDNKSTAIVASALDDVEKQRREIGGAFKHFSALYDIYGKRRSSHAPCTEKKASPAADSVDSVLDIIQSSFDNYPFHISGSTSDITRIVDRLRYLNTNREYAEQHEGAMKTLGERWVADKLDGGADKASLERIQIELLHNFARSAQMEPGAQESIAVDNKEQTAKMHAIIQSAARRSKSQKFSIAFCGMVKAGKSLFLNALMGRMLLPSDELPSTAWPCRLRHVKGQHTPTLEVNIHPFEKGIQELHERQYGIMMAKYSPLTDDSETDFFSDGEVTPDGSSASSSEEASAVYLEWVDLHPATKENLRKFEASHFRLRKSASGEKDVTTLLGELNDIVRLCHRFKLPFNMDDKNWPVLSVEFDSLRNENVEGTFEFIDLPGIGESFEQYDFVDLIRRVAEDADAVVPIISFKEIPKKDWRLLPEIVQNGIGRAPDLVICTHLDEVTRERLQEQKSNVAKVFWPSHPASVDRVLACSSRFGLSATSLLRASQHKKPSFKDIWPSDKTAIQYACAKEILGVGSPERGYERYDLHSWTRAVTGQLHDSGLPTAITRLTRDMVLDSRQRLLVIEGDKLRKLLRKLTRDQTHILLGMRRSELEYQKALDEFQSANRKIEGVLGHWTVEETRMQLDGAAQLQKAFEKLDGKVRSMINDAIRSAEHECDGNKVKVVDKNTFMFKNKKEAGLFFARSQKNLKLPLSTLKQQYGTFVSDVAKRVRDERYDKLKDIIHDSVKDTSLQLELDDVALEELDSSGAEVMKLIMSVKQDLGRLFVSYIFKPVAAIEAFFFRKLRKMSTTSADLLARSTPVSISKDALADTLMDKYVQPFLIKMKHKGETTLGETMKKSLCAAKEAVEAALANQRKRFEAEGALRSKPPPNAVIAGAVAQLSDFLATDAGLLKLREHLKDIL